MNHCGKFQNDYAKESWATLQHHRGNGIPRIPHSHRVDQLSGRKVDGRQGYILPEDAGEFHRHVGDSVSLSYLNFTMTPTKYQGKIKNN